MENMKSVLQQLDEQRSSVGIAPHSWYPPLVHISAIPAQRTPSDTQSGNLSHSSVPVLEARVLKAQNTRDKLK